MDFTREPIIETIITPKEGFKLVIRSSKSSGQEEYFVDSVEIVSFGKSLFFRSIEKPKAFLAPVSDYEVVEVREARMVLRNVGVDRSIKIGGGKEGKKEFPAEAKKEKVSLEADEPQMANVQNKPEKEEARSDKKRERRRNFKRRREPRQEAPKEGEEIKSEQLEVTEEKVSLPEPKHLGREEEQETNRQILNSPLLSSLLQPPETLISETLSRYKENAMFKGVFYKNEEEEKQGEEPILEFPTEQAEENETTKDESIN